MTEVDGEYPTDLVGLIAEVRAETVSDTPLGDDDDLDITWIRGHLAGPPPISAPEVARAVDWLCGGDPPLQSTDRRRTVISRLEEALELRRFEREMLQLMLFARRTEMKRSLEEIATQLDTSPEKLSDVEDGKTPITELEAETVAKWARLVAVPQSLGKQAYRRSLDTASPSLALAAGTDYAQPSNAQKLDLQAKFDAAWEREWESCDTPDGPVS